MSSTGRLTSRKNARLAVAFLLAASGGAIISAGKVYAANGIRSVSALKSDSRAHDSVAVTNTTSVPLAGGGQGTTVTLENGTSIQYEIPPSGFNPIAASASALQLYCFPAKPAGGGALTVWNNAMSHWRSAPVPDLSFSSTPLMAPPNATTSQTNNITPNPLSVISNQPWAGFVNDSSVNEFLGSEGEFNVPTVTDTSACNYPRLGLWTGIGGEQGSFLIIQSGIVFNDAGSYHPPSSDWEGFFQYFDFANYTGIGVTDLIAKDHKSWTIVPGHEMWSVTTYDPANYTATWFLEDVTNGNSATFSYSVPTFYDGTSAEAIDEQSGGQHADASRVNWIYVETQFPHGDWQPLSSYAQNKYIGLYATPSTLSTTDNTSWNVTNDSGC